MQLGVSTSASPTPGSSLSSPSPMRSVFPCVVWTALLQSPLVLARVISVVIKYLSYTKVVPVAHGQEGVSSHGFKAPGLESFTLTPSCAQVCRAERDRPFCFP